MVDDFVLIRSLTRKNLIKVHLFRFFLIFSTKKKSLESLKENDLQFTDILKKYRKEKRYFKMLKITIQDNDGAKIYFADSVEFMNYVEDRAYTRVVLHTPKAKVKSCMFMLEPGDNVFVEEI